MRPDWRAEWSGNLVAHALDALLCPEYNAAGEGK